MNKHIPLSWKSKIKRIQTDLEGASPAEVIKFKSGKDYLYLKSIDKKYSETTFSVKREKDVMQWLNGKLIVPEVIDFVCEDNREFLIMSELKGRHIDDFKTDPETCVQIFANCIKKIQSIDISNCPFDSGLNIRLTELGYLLQRGLASTDDWESTTKFSDTSEFYKWLCENKPSEELVFSHGDLNANVFIDGNNYCFYDLGRAGIADKWLDIAFCISDIREYKNKKYEDMFFKLLNIEPNYEKIEYFLLLDEMF